MATVVDTVKESLLGATLPADLTQESRTTFLRHAKKDDNGDLYMEEEDFIDAIAPPDENYHKIKREQYGILFDAADRRKQGRIGMSEWATFDNLLKKSDSGYELAFRLFDVEGTGFVKSEVFQKIYEQNRGRDGIPFDFNSEWAALYIGGKKRRHEMTYPQFAQMMRGLQGERVRQAFHLYDTDKDGYIDPEDFEKIIRSTASHKLSDHLLENLPTLCNLDVSQGSKISYANVRAFQNVIREMDLIDLIIRNATSRAADGKITKADFLNEANRFTRFTLYTPMEADILFHFAGLDSEAGRLAMSDFIKVLDASWQLPEQLPGSRIDTHKVATRGQQVLHQVLESAHHFGLGAIAGAFGAFMVYPIDLVKTRMQNQRSTNPGSRLYNNSLDCAQKIIKNEGFRGLYAGVLPQLVGVAPEKAIKLTVNDIVRTHFTDKNTNQIAFAAEMLAGGSAGACQVIFTNPLEIVKIRLQVQGELAKKADVPKRSAMWIVRNLGLFGLYKGASACLLRDVPFSMIYFPTYNHLKRDFFGESQTKKLGVLQLLTAGAIAGMPAAYLTTPCDVVKTRLQVEARKGEAVYTGLTDCAKQVYRDEGFKAFFKGGPARIMRSSPQFGFTLAAYEVLSTLLPMPGSEAAQAAKSTKVEPDVGLREASAPLPYLRSRNALKIILDLDENFGRGRVPKMEGHGNGKDGRGGGGGASGWTGVPGFTRPLRA